MKRLINILLSASMLLVVSSCSSDLPLDRTLSDTEFGIALRSIEIINGLDLADPSSTYLNRLEIDAVDGGKIPQSIRVLVGFTDDDETAATETAPADPANSMDPVEFMTMTPDEFNQTTDINTHGLPVGVFEASLSDLASFLGLTAADYDRGDQFDFEFEMIATDGTVFNSSNVGANVAAAGRFSFYNSPFSWSAAIDDPSRIVLSSAEVAEDSLTVLRSGVTSTVVLTFDGSTIVTNPTITRTSTSGNTDDVIGALSVDEGVITFDYTAGAAASDAITFAITGAESTAGVPMEDVTFKSAFKVDNVAPTVTLGGAGARLTEETGGEIKAITVDVLFSEEVSGKVTYTIESAQFDTVTIVQDAAGEEEASIEFKPLIGTTELATTNLNFTVTASGTARTVAGGETAGIDAAGNSIAGVIAVSIL